MFFSSFFEFCFYHKSGIANNRHKSIDYNVLLYGKVYLRWKKEKIFKPWTNLVKLWTLEFFIYLFCSIIIKIIFFFLLSVLHNSLFIRIMTILVAHKQITQNVYYKQEILNNRCRMFFLHIDKVCVQYIFQTRYVSKFLSAVLCKSLVQEVILQTEVVR